MRRLVFTVQLLAVAFLAASALPAAAQDPTAQDPTAQDPTAQDAGARPAPDAASAQPDVESLVAGLKSKEYSERVLAAEAALEVQDAKLTRPLTKVLTDERYEVRTAAIRALGNRDAEADQKAAAKALAARLSKLSKDQSDEIELLLAVEALGDLARPESIPALVGGLEHDTDPDIADARLKAVAQIPHKDAIEALIKIMSKGRKRANAHQAAHRALRVATGERFGGDPDAWRAWWKDNAKTFDFDAAAARRAEDKERAAEKAERKRKRGEGRKKKDD